jgi:hypothetical protein
MMSAEQIAQHWMDEITRTVAKRDYPAHMDLISRRVRLTGIPEFESIGYEDWARQCQHEFADGVIASVVYRGFKLRAATDSRVMFKTFEQVAATDGTVNAQGIEVVLEKEDDGKWRLLHERVLPEDETRQDGLLEN